MEDLDNMLWRAFLLGARVMAGQKGRELSSVEIEALARISQQIAESETTLEDPTELVLKFPDMADTFQRLGSLMIRNNRELATRIFAGFRLATEIEDQP